jgi:hypothetical protein
METYVMRRIFAREFCKEGRSMMISQKHEDEVKPREKASFPVEEKHRAVLIEERSIFKPTTVPPGAVGRRFPLSWRRLMLVGVKAAHSLIYFSIESCMGYIIYAGMKRREDRRVAIAAGVVVGECIIFLGNRCRCPLTGLAENLGAANGSVTDIYLPRWFASNLVWIHVPLLALALYLHVRNLLRWSRA